MRVRSPGWPPEGPAGGDSGRWQSALVPTKEQQAQSAAVCQFATDPPPPKKPPSPTVDPPPFGCHLLCRSFGNSPRGWGPCTPSRVPLESGRLGSAEARLIPKRAPGARLTG